ncbi:hypothetical protein DRP07_08810 [Archaeoglobales archaeon]|nr:MAG: hypothetical protein DRP07_08810 [Archaeoglobales archaeon]
MIFHRWNGWYPLGMDSSGDDIKWIVEGIDTYYEDKILIDLGIIKICLREFITEIPINVTKK